MFRKFLAAAVCLLLIMAGPGSAEDLLAVPENEAAGVPGEVSADMPADGPVTDPETGVLAENREDGTGEPSEPNAGETAGGTGEEAAPEENRTGEPAGETEEGAAAPEENQTGEPEDETVDAAAVPEENQAGEPAGETGEAAGAPEENLSGEPDGETDDAAAPEENRAGEGSEGPAGEPENRPEGDEPAPEEPTAPAETPAPEPVPAAPAMPPAPVTQTDLPCLHEQTVTTIYFFDSPSYTSLSAATHLVSGPAVIETVCRDCGALISAETVDNAEEIRPHSMKKGACALCGYHQPTTAGGSKQDAPGERTLIAQPDGSGLLFLTLSEEDLAALEKAKVKTLLVRGESGNAVVAMDVRELRQETMRDAASLSVEIAEREDGSFFAGLSLFTAPGKRQEPDSKGVMLRFYRDEDGEAARVAITPAGGSGLTETDGVWDEGGYWTVPYREEGEYLLIQE